MRELPLKDLLIPLLILFDIIILIVLIYLYYKFKKILTFPWEDFERSLERAQALVERLRELKALDERSKKRDSGGNLEERVIESFREGLSLKEIAKRFNLTTGEVEIILKKRGIIR